ncbi:NADH-FMN oxidoreductase RutF, flavin reductase (DIM6/NTAB) family [Neorhodopirellula lusitana]|uniref:NADH-FMN oxidoreductase RutF, flavin reductase (DIM6/NTAB) family n=1 Tax=Neorhodopirellula lusitana TaxID=445327 RepID=A0ABY1QPD3_9BACT|nr:flavin reductase family protein [Neorhodopirellula lusitana]SMP77059.1 NADH-FMN oxidoreductase RutF, flavin reductase (DIM6/NTAB) family [Neorhodopirellula lusitana]
MNIQPDQVSVRQFYEAMVATITPRPIAWVSTIDAEGTCNLAPYSFFNGVGANPPTLMFCPANKGDGTAKDTLANIRANGEFVVNVVTEAFFDAMKLSASDVAADEDEFTLTGTQKAPSDFVKPPRVRDVVAAMECELLTSMQLGVGPGGANLVVGKIVSIYVADSALDESGSLNADQIRPIGRMGGPRYTKTNDQIE